MTFEAIQFDEENNEWVDVGSINEVVYFQEGSVDDVEEYLPPDFELEGSTIVFAETNFNMENSSGFTRIVGNYAGLSDTLGLQINSTEASFVEILPPFQVKSLFKVVVVQNQLFLLLKSEMVMVI